MNHNLDALTVEELNRIILASRKENRQAKPILKRLFHDACYISEVETEGKGIHYTLDDTCIRNTDTDDFISYDDIEDITAIYCYRYEEVIAEVCIEAVIEGIRNTLTLEIAYNAI